MLLLLRLLLFYFIFCPIVCAYQLVYVWLVLSNNNNAPLGYIKWRQISHRTNHSSFLKTKFYLLIRTQMYINISILKFTVTQCRQRTIRLLIFAFRFHIAQETINVESILCKQNKRKKKKKEERTNEDGKCAVFIRWPRKLGSWYYVENNGKHLFNVHKQAE